MSCPTAETKNTGQGCRPNVGYIQAEVFFDVKSNFAFPDRASVTLSALLATFSADRPDRGYPVVYSDQPTVGDNTPVFETLAQGIENEVDLTSGKTESVVSLVGDCEQKRLKSFNKTKQFSVGLTSNGFIVATELADGRIRGIKKSVSVTSMMGTKAQSNSVKFITQAVNPDDIESRPAYISVEGLVAKDMEGIIDAVLTELIAATTTTLTVLVTEKCSGSAIEGRLQTDFILINVTVPLIPVDEPITVFLDNGNGSYKLDYALLSAGSYSLSLETPDNSSDGLYETLTPYTFTI